MVYRIIKVKKLKRGKKASLFLTFPPGTKKSDAMKIKRMAKKTHYKNKKNISLILDGPGA